MKTRSQGSLCPCRNLNQRILKRTYKSEASLYILLIGPKTRDQDKRTQKLICQLFGSMNMTQKQEQGY
jgi:hypothetical protein